MRKVLFLAGIIAGLSSCGDGRSDTEGAGNTDTASTNTMIGTGNGSNLQGGGDTTNLAGGNARGQAEDSANAGRTPGSDTSYQKH
jgi:hypothetical protein